MAQCQDNSKIIPVSEIYRSFKKNKSIVTHTPLLKSNYLSEKYKANVWIKREDLQAIRSFKIRGAATAFSKLTKEQRERGVVTASAGNHAQGIAYCCKKFQIKGTIFMPQITPKLKINSVKHHGGQWLDIVLTGVTFDDAVAQAFKFQQKTNTVFIHAFDNKHVVEGQGGTAVEILEDWKQQNLDYLFVCCGGGGLLSGMGCYFHQMSPQTKVYGFEPLGSPSMYNSLQEDKPIVLKELQTFVDGASMKTTSKITFEIIRELGIPIKLISEGLVAKTMLDIYTNQAIILEPAGALSIAGLQLMKDEIVGKNIVCVLSGSNNDISRLPQIRLRCRLFQNKEAYYVISSASMINIHILIDQIVNPEQNEIVLLNSAKKYNVSSSECVIGIQFFDPKFKQPFEERLIANRYKYNQLQPKDPLLRILVSF